MTTVFNPSKLRFHYSTLLITISHALDEIERTISDGNLSLKEIDNLKLLKSDLLSTKGRFECMLETILTTNGI